MRRNYSYSTSAWGDLLTSYRGNSITYDEIGNPLNYYNGASYTFTWTGKDLTGAVKGGKRPPIHHPNGKFGPHFHPNNPKFSHWHYYYILVFSASQLDQEG